jgi:hypothetical protein
MERTRMLRPTACLAALALLTGCAATPTADAPEGSGIDKEYVAAVERQARLLPLKVIWVNPPTRKTSSVVLYLDPPRGE